MHLTVITNLFPPYVVGGYEMVCAEVVAALRRRGHRVSVLCGHGSRLAQDEDLRGILGLDLDRIDETFLGGRPPSPREAFQRHLFSLESYRATRQHLAELRPDAVAVWNLYMASVAPLVAAQRTQAPVIVHLLDKWLYHSLCDLASLLRPQVPWKRLLLRLTEGTVQSLLRRTARPQHVIAVSDFIRRFYIRAGFSDQTIGVERLGVPTAAFAFTPRPPRHAAEPLRLLFVGALWEGKGPLTAVRALGRLVRSGLAVHLDVCGDGAPRFIAALQALIAEEGVGAHVALHGRLPRERVREMCQSRDVLVFPSEWDEPFASVPLEAMSCGMAVVATSSGGTPEAIEDGETGLLVPPGDAAALAQAVRRLAHDDDLRRHLGVQAGRHVREHFDFDDYVVRLEGRYRRIIEGLPGFGDPDRRSEKA